MKGFKLKINYLLIPILIILLLSLGTVSASYIDCDDSSNIDALLVDGDSEDIGGMDSIEISEGDSADSSNVVSSNALNDDSEGDDSTVKSFSDIQSAIDDASEDSTIELNGTYTGSEPVKLNKSLKFLGKEDKAVIQCDDSSIFMEIITNPLAVKFENIKFISTSYNPSFFYVDDGVNLSFENCIFENISTGVQYGDLYVNNSLLIHSYLGTDYSSGIVNNSNFTQNSHIGIGKDGRVDIYNCNFVDGNASAIFSYGGVDIINCTFRNFTAQNGGAIYLDGGYKFIKNCVFINNVANGYGGAIYCDPWSNDVFVENCSFINNSAKFGSAIAWNSSNFATISNCIFDNNKALGSNSLDTTLYFLKDFNTTRDFSKLNITANNNYWGSNNVVLSDIFKSKNGETFKLGNILTLKLKSNGENSYTLYFANSSGSKVSKMPNYYVTLKDRRTGAVIVRDLLLENGEATFGYANNTLNMDVIDILNNGGKSVTKLSVTVTPTKLVAYYRSGKTFNIKVVDKYSKKAISGIKLNLKVYTGKKYKTYYVTTNSKGMAIFKASALAIGTHKVEITSSNKKYSVSKTTSSIKINNAKTIISAPKISVKYKKSYYFKVRAKHMSTKKYIRGLKIKLRIYTGKKYKTYTVKTNTKGLAKFNTKNLKRGTHKVVIISGNSNYVVSKKSSIKIR